jgi:hypothetical protein
MMSLTENGRILTIIIFFRMLFGGYIIAMDQYRYSDVDSAWTVLIIYLLIGAFTSLYISGKHVYLKALLVLEGLFLVLNIVFTVISLGGYADVGMHNPLENIWETILRFSFSLITLLYAYRAYREPSQS